MFFNRAYIEVDGPSGSGKTLLIERLLESNRSKQISAIRFLESDSIDKPAQDRNGNEETKRYYNAGADATLLCRYPIAKSFQAGEWFWESGFLLGYDPDGIIIEGRGDFNLNPDLFVYVTRPLGQDECLIFKKKCEVGRLDFKDYIRLVTGVELKNDPIIYEDGEAPEDELLADGGEVIEEEIIEVPDEFAEYIKHGFPLHQDMWCIKESHAGIARANVVVINVYREDERPAAEQLAKAIRRIYEDEEVCKDVISFYGSRRFPSIYIANLADRKDNELKKGIARIKRLAFQP